MDAKTKITCFECNTSFRFDVSRLPANVSEKECIKCGSKIPLLGRKLQIKQKSSKPPKHVEHDKKSNRPEKAQAVDSISYLDGGGNEDRLAVPEYESDEGASWLATYGDIMSLLLIFFILMFAISTINQQKFKSVMNAISNSLGGQITFAEMPVSQKESAILVIKKEMQAEKSALSNLYQMLHMFLEESRLTDKIALFDEDQDMVLITQKLTMFDSGKSELRPEILPYLKRISEILHLIENRVVVEGHTDNVPIHTDRFTSNWELSTLRAANVVHFLINECDMDPQQLSVAGYSYFKPRYDFSTPEGKFNRRIEIRIRKKYATHLADQILTTQ